jgi:hypothetical protein
MLDCNLYWNYNLQGSTYFFSTKHRGTRMKFVSDLRQATFNTISVRSWWSVLFVEEIGVPEENH